MADSTNEVQDDNTNVTPPAAKTEVPVADDLVTKIVSEKVNEALKEIKPKLDAAYHARDEALKKVAEFEKKEKEAQLKLLEEQGKIKEAMDLRLAEKEAELSTLRRHNTELSRDVQVRNALSGIDFRNEVAADMGYRQIVDQLVQNDKGQWVHKSGVSIKDFVEQFGKDENNSFLFKPKQSSGTGASASSSTTVKSTGKKSLFEMSQAEVLAKAAKGEFGQPPQF